MSRIKDTHGSILIAALIVALITGSLVGLFLKTVTQEAEYSYRARMSFQAVNLAEAGIDYAIYSYANDNWTDWSTSGDGHYRSTFTHLTRPVGYGSNLLGTNEDYEVKVYAQDGDPGSDDPADLPVVVAEGTIKLKSGATVSRQILVRLQYGASDDPSKGGFWGNGITAKKSITFAGNKQQMDSFKSSDNPLGYGNIQDIYDDQVGTTIFGHKLANGYCAVGSNSVTVTDLSIGNADIFGSLATGAAQADADLTTVIGPKGSVYNEETIRGDDTIDGTIDTHYLAYDFYAQLPDVSAPTLSSPATEFTGTVVGETGLGTEYEVTGVKLAGTDAWTVEGDVVLYVDGDFSISGSAMIELAANASLELYVSGEIDITGGGIVNTSLPENLTIFSTGSGDVKLAGNGNLSAAVYAPNSDVTLGGGGSKGAMFGAIVGESVKLNGDYPFHYDEDLGNLATDDDPSDDSFTPEVHSWVELTDASQRKNMDSILSDGL